MTDDKEIKYKKILNDLPFNIFFLSKDYKLLWMNKNALKDNDLNLNKILDKKCYEIFYNKTVPCNDCFLNQNEKSENKNQEIKYQDKTLLMHVKPYFSNNNLSYYTISYLDISKQKEIKKELEFEKIKTNFFTSLSHEFRTPVNMINTSLQILSNNIKHSNITPDISEYLFNHIKIITQNNYRLIRVVDNLLDLNKMDAGYYKFKLKNIDIVNFIYKIVKSSEEYIKNQNKNITFKTNLKKKVIAVDPFEIERVIINLISNAIKFTSPEDSITIEIKDKKDKIIIAVEDTGMGIPEEKQKIIFQEFKQIKNNLTREKEGSGLGLPISKLIIKNHDGEIKLKSKPGKGSRFEIILPIKKAKEKSDREKTKSLNNFDIERIKIEFSDIYS